MPRARLCAMPRLQIRRRRVKVRCMAPVLRVVVMSLLCAPVVQASSKVTLTPGSPSLSARYSQAVALEATLAKDGVALDGSSACDEPSTVLVELCRVRFELVPASGGDIILITEPDVVVDAAGRARARLSLVDGRHGGASFQSDPEGFDYTVTARFLGAGIPQPDVSDPDCQDGAPDIDDGTLCPQVGVATLSVTPEIPALEFAQDIIMNIGERVTLAASLVDETGDADAAGEAVDGTAEKALEGVSIRFFYDVDADGRPSADERLGEAVTNAAGVAAFEFFADPSFVTAGVFEAGLHAEFPGDARYALARGSVRLTLNAGGADPAATIIEVSPKTLNGNGVDEAVITVRLVDENGNILGPDSPDADVVVSTDLGRILDDVERDPLDGTYGAVLRAPRQGGTATVTVTVDGEAAGSATVDIIGKQGCTCGSSTLSGSALALLLMPLVRRRRRRSVAGGERQIA